ncbi:Protein YELLOW LEAF 1, choloroplastic [Camellia lanceoleosa]|uniref:Protein YELLOW LEAF 1, choloroplastic n=1 Tax=Camellia lanceoleosa TaxID=1840588 RepID=A0ACC0H8I9_9ERIC|nr:Protein YELLOW LEAF 1, choloroplastic [Camellia lanceoleosa]
MRMSSLTASTVPTPATISSGLHTVRSESQCRRQTKLSCSFPLGLMPLGLQLKPLDRRHIIHAVQMRSASIICAAALNATCAAEQTQTVTRQSSTITVAPIQGKEKSPELDDGGTGFPPRDDGDGGGGGGGGGGGWTGGFFFFGFLAFLGFLKDQESEGPYQDSRRRRQGNY